MTDKNETAKICRAEFQVDAGRLRRGEVRPAAQYAADRYGVALKIYENKGFINSIFTIVLEGEEVNVRAAINTTKMMLRE